MIPLSKRRKLHRSFSHAPVNAVISVGLSARLALDRRMAQKQKDNGKDPPIVSLISGGLAGGVEASVTVSHINLTHRKRITCIDCCGVLFKRMLTI